MGHNVEGDPIAFHQPAVTPTLRMYWPVSVSRAYEASKISNQRCQMAQKNVPDSCKCKKQHEISYCMNCIGKDAIEQLTASDDNIFDR